MVPLRSTAMRRSSLSLSLSAAPAPVKISAPAMLAQISMRPKAVQGLLDEALDIGRRGDVRLDRPCLSAGLADLGAKQLGLGLRSVVVHHHAGALQGEEPGDRPADATTGAGDDRGLVVQPVWGHGGSSLVPSRWPPQPR